MMTPAVILKKSFLLLLLGTLLSMLGYSFALATNTEPTNQPVTKTRAKQTQLGFYDLLAEKQEVYDLQIKNTSANNYLALLSLPEDPRFILRGKIVIVKAENNSYSHLDFTPIYYHNPKPNRMINSFVDYTTHNDSLIRDLKTDNSQLIVTRTGMLILMPELFSIPGN